MDLLILPAMLFLLGSYISIVSKTFRKYWLIAISCPTIGALAFQLAVYLQLGFLDPFYQIAFVTSWFILFGLTTIVYVGYSAIKRQSRRQET